MAKNPRERDPRDPLITRGLYGFNAAGALTMGTLRILAPVLQLAIVTRKVDAASVLPRFFGGSLSPPHPAVAMGLNLTSLRNLRTYQTLVVSLCAGSALKHILWVGYINNENLAPLSGLVIGLFNGVGDCINSMLSLWSITSPVGSAYADSSALLKNPTVVIGAMLYITGLTMEIVSELQRKSFKDRPESNGKPYTGGLWKLARHVNYGGYTLWRTGAAMVSGGLAWGLFNFSWSFYGFANRGIPVLDEYCGKKYGEQWTQFRAEVKYKLIPWVY